MIAKGTADYKMAQQNARVISDMAACDRVHGQLLWGEAETELSQTLDEIIEKVDGFAAEVAKTVRSTVRQWTDRAYAVARCSDKQAWILACACVENNISVF